MNETRLGAKVRQLRRQARITQVELARRLDISTSYLNLIEHDQRALTADLLIKVAQEFKVDLATFAQSTDHRLSADLIEVFSDPMFDGHSLTAVDLREVSESASPVARAVLTLYQAYQTARNLNETLAGRIYEDTDMPGVHLARLPSEEVNEFVQHHMNWFPALEVAAEQLWKDAELREDDLYAGLLRHIQRRPGIEVKIARTGAKAAPLRHYDPVRRVLALSEALAPHSRRFQIAVQIALLEYGELLDQLAADRMLTTADSRALARVVLAGWFAGAVLMPYTAFLETTRQERYDIELLGNRFGTSFEQVCHRLTTLRKPGHEGVPLHMVRVDLAGNISKHFSASGIRFARFSGACPRWNIHAAFLTPGLIRTQLSQMPDGTTYFCLARTVPKGRGGFHAPHTIQAIGLGCNVRHAPDMVYADGMDLAAIDAAIPVGVTCRLCDRTECEQRAFPSLRHLLAIDENLRGSSLYMPARTAKA